MAQFEGYERRESKILGVLANYGISSIDECKEICDKYGVDAYTIVQETKAKTKKGEEADEEEEDERRLKDLADELKAVVKEVQWYKYWGKKKELENMNKEKNDSKERGMDGDEDYNNYE